MKFQSYILLFLLFSTMLLTGSCESGNVGRLKAMIKDERPNLPIKLANGDELTLISYNQPSNILNLEIKINNNLLLDNIQTNKEIALKYFRTSFMNLDWRLPNAIDNSGAVVAVKFISKNQKKSVSFNISHTEFNKLLLSNLTPSEKNLAILEDMVEIENFICPRDAGHGLEMTSVALGKQNLVITFEFDESILKGNEFKDYIKRVAPTYKQGLQNSIPETNLKILKDQGLGIVYQWKGNQGYKPFSIIVKPEEIII